MKILTIRLVGSPENPLLPAEALSLLMGVPVDEVRAHGQSQGTGVMTLPSEWMKAGRRRAREAHAHTGSNSMVAGLEYWAEKDHGARLDLVYVDPFGGAA